MNNLFDPLSEDLKHLKDLFKHIEPQGYVE